MLLARLKLELGIGWVTLPRRELIAVQAGRLGEDVGAIKAAGVCQLDLELLRVRNEFLAFAAKACRIGLVYSTAGCAHVQLSRLNGMAEGILARGCCHERFGGLVGVKVSGLVTLVTNSGMRFARARWLAMR